MPLAALIIADEEQAASAPLVFGLPVIEYQARLAQQAGANHIVIVTAQVAAGLVAALDRLRARGMNVALARTAREAADLVHPDETLILFDAGTIPRSSLLAQLAHGEGMRIATFPLNPRHPERELIDADHAWAGLARIDGSIVRRTAEILGDWALAPTLLRFAVQAGATRERLEDGEASPVRNVRTAADAQAVTGSIVAGDGEPVQGPLGAVLGPSATLLAGQAGRIGVPPPVLELIGAGLLALSFGAALTGWTLTALLTVPVAALIGLAALRLGSAALGQSRYFGRFQIALLWAGRAALLAAGYRAWADGWGWGSGVIALWLVWELVQRGEPKSRLDPDEVSSTLIAGIGLAAGYPVAGLSLALAHALVPRIFAAFRSHP